MQCNYLKYSDHPFPEYVSRGGSKCRTSTASKKETDETVEEEPHLDKCESDADPEDSIVGNCKSDGDCNCDGNGGIDKDNGGDNGDDNGDTIVFREETSGLQGEYFWVGRRHEAPGCRIEEELLMRGMDRVLGDAPSEELL